MASKKRKREREDCTSKRTKHHHEQFLKREKARLEHEQEKQSLQLIAELQQKEKEEQQKKKNQEANHLMLCIDLEHGDARKDIEFKFNRRKNVTGADRERLKQDLEFVDSRYEDMRKQLVKKEPAPETDPEPAPEPAPETEPEPETEKRLLHLESCGEKKLQDVSYIDIRAYKYARLSLETRSLTSEQLERFEIALKRCKMNGWK
jgi:hypothetical protein